MLLLPPGSGNALLLLLLSFRMNRPWSTVVDLSKVIYPTMEIELGRNSHKSQVTFDFHLFLQPNDFGQHTATFQFLRYFPAGLFLSTLPRAENPQN